MIRVAAGILIGMIVIGVAYAQGVGFMAGLYESSPSTYTSGQFAPVAIDANGSVRVTAGTGLANLGKAEDDVATTAGTGVAALVKQDATPSDDATDGDYALPQMDDGALWTRTLTEQGFVITSTITRIADHTAYTAGDAVSDSTTTPTTGGFTLTGACRVSGGTGVITDIIITDTDDAAVLLTPTLRLYNTAVTAINDNAAFAVTDAEAQTMVAKIVGTILIDEGAQDALHISGLNIVYNCAGSANLRYLLQTTNAYDPAANSGVIQVMVKGRWTS